MPNKPSNEKGTLLLGYLEDDNTDEHLDIGEHLPRSLHAEISYPMLMSCRAPDSFRL